MISDNQIATHRLLHEAVYSNTSALFAEFVIIIPVYKHSVLIAEAVEFGIGPNGCGNALVDHRERRLPQRRDASGLPFFRAQLRQRRLYQQAERRPEFGAQRSN